MSVQGLVVKRSERSRSCRVLPVCASSRGQSSQLTLSSAQRGQREERESFHVCKHRACVYHRSLLGFHGDRVAFYLRYLRPRAPHDTAPGICYLTFQDRGRKKRKKERALRETLGPITNVPFLLAAVILDASTSTGISAIRG